jgi:AraC-like DNA-binding protein
MDRHEIPQDITAEHVASMHQADLKVQHLYGCKGMTYWCDEERRTAFCLIEAPNEKAIREMHKNAHGDLPHSIIEVNKNIVESFLGRIENPEKVENELVKTLSDPAFRVIMVIEISNYLNRVEGDQFTIFTQKLHNSVSKTIKQFNGSEIRKDNNSYLVSFKSVSDAVLCALKVQFNFKYVTPKHKAFNRRLNIALSAGDPVIPGKRLFEDAINLATRMCEIVADRLVISSEVNALYESENQHAIIDKELIRSLKPDEEKFLTYLMNHTEKNWNKPAFNVDSFSKELGYSKSQLYRKLKYLTGKSPNHFIREFRLRKALDLLHRQEGNISEIAYETGFNSPTYFSKCFLDTYGILPSKYVQQHIY